MSHNDLVPIHTFAQPAFLSYAMKVVKDRAIPDIEDGLKPVQRRILFAMSQLNLLGPGVKPKKSARIVGDVIGKYHPHGDSAVYEAMVRMAQPFAMRYPLVHGEGNFGSRDGDRAAAMRYTEVSLAPLASALLDELSWDTVDFRPNYDNALTEPTILPTRMPFALLNGSYGIAVGMATNIPSHNMVEVVEAIKLVLNNKKTTLDEVLAVMPGPDFATGANLISSQDDIRKVYAEGRGSLRVRATWRIEHTGKGNKDWRMVVTELPPDTSTAKIMVAIDELLNPQPAEKNGKKQPLRLEQQRLKKMFSELIDEVRDSSDKDNPIALVIEPKSRSVDPEVLAMSLCAHTDMEMNISPNFVIVDLNGNPRQSNLLDWMGQWCEHRVTTVRRRLSDEKKRVDHRLHILEGRLTILDKIQEVISIIQNSSDPKSDIMTTFKLSEVQALDVLDMRLRSLANLEKIKIQDEHAKLLTEQTRLAKLLGSDTLIRKLITKELDEDVKKFGDARRTKLMPTVPAVSKKTLEDSVVTVMAPEPVSVALTERGWLSWRPCKAGEEVGPDDHKTKTGDTVRRIYHGDRAHALLLVSAKGRAYSLRLSDLPSKSDTAPVTQFFDLDPDDRVLEGAIAQPQDKFVIAGQGGYGFVVQASDWINRMKAGKAFLTLDAQEHPLPPLPLPADLADQTLVALSSDGRAVAFALNEVKVLPKGKGVGLIGLAPDATLADIALHHASTPAVLLPTKGKPYSLPQTDVDAMMGPRSASKKGKMLHKHAAGAVFHRPNRSLPAPSAPQS